MPEKKATDDSKLIDDIVNMANETENKPTGSAVADSTNEDLLT